MRAKQLGCEQWQLLHTERTKHTERSKHAKHPQHTGGVDAAADAADTAADISPLSSTTPRRKLCPTLVLS